MSAKRSALRGKLLREQTDELLVVLRCSIVDMPEKSGWMLFGGWMLFQHQHRAQRPSFSKNRFARRSTIISCTVVVVVPHPFFTVQYTIQCVCMCACIQGNFHGVSNFLCNITSIQTKFYVKAYIDYITWRKKWRIFWGKIFALSLAEKKCL